MNPLRFGLQVISWTACGLTILPAVAFLIGWISLDQMKGWMLAATVVWFVVTPCWMGREQGSLAEPSHRDGDAALE